jgi:hypothetical protein
VRESDIDQAERLETLANDKLLREAEHRRLAREGTTFHRFGQSQANDEAGGRFAAINAATVVGSQPSPASQYPACSPALAVQLPDEPPLSAHENSAFEEPSAVSVTAAEQLGGAADAPSASSSLLPGVERVAPPSFSEDQDNG